MRINFSFLDSKRRIIDDDESQQNVADILNTDNADL